MSAIIVCLIANKETMYRQFMQDEDKSPYQPTLSDLQHNLFQSLPTPVKDVILLVKYWRRHRLMLRTDKPAARFYELLVIHCWELAGNPEAFNLAAALKSVFTALSEWKNIHITWEESRSLLYPRRIAEGNKRDIISRYIFMVQVSTILLGSFDKYVMSASIHCLTVKIYFSIQVR